MEATSLDMHEELRRAQECERAGHPLEALAILKAIAGVDNSFVPWIWYSIVTIAERIGDTDLLVEYSVRFNQSPMTKDGHYRVAHVDLLIRRIVYLSQTEQDARGEVETLMAFEPSRGELDRIYSSPFKHLLPHRVGIAADRTIKAPWDCWTAYRKPVRLGAPHYAIDKPPHPYRVPTLHIAHGAQYVTNGRDSGLVRNNLWFTELGASPSIESTLAHLRSVRGNPVKLPGRGLILSDHFTGDNYCHWTLDWIPRILLAQEFGGGFDWLFVRASRNAFQLRWFEKLGINPFKIIFEDGLAWYALDEFIYADNGNIAATHPAYGGHPEILRRIRRAVQAGAPESGPPLARRLYISRGDSTGRAILNEAEVVAMLGQRGFETVSLSKLSLDEQVALFGSAEIVVGTHGAGLTNLIFLPPNAIVVELLHHQYGTPSYSLLSLTEELSYYYLTCAEHEADVISEAPTQPSNPTAFITAPIWVNVDKLAQAVDRFL